MYELVRERFGEIVTLCREFGVRRLDVFGSVLDESFDPLTSDVDVLVEFVGGAGFDYVESYFGLKESLEELFGRPVDLVSAASIVNPYFRDTERSLGEYESDAMLRSAVERQLEIIGDDALVWQLVNRPPAASSGSRSQSPVARRPAVMGLLTTVQATPSWCRGSVIRGDIR